MLVDYESYVSETLWLRIKILWSWVSHILGTGVKSPTDLGLFDQGYISINFDARLPIEFGLNIYEKFN